MASISDLICCICQSLLNRTNDVENEDNLDRKEEPCVTPPRGLLLSCCFRHICIQCQKTNPRFRFYCPFCQIYKKMSAEERENLEGAVCVPQKILEGLHAIQMLPQGLGPPPEYSAEAMPRYGKTNEIANPHFAEAVVVEPPPVYDHSGSILAAPKQHPHNCSPSDHPQDTTHFLNPEDTLFSLAIAYSVPIRVLLKHNRLNDANLLHARQKIIIPWQYNKRGVSLSASPTQSSEELERKARQRRFMMETKCADYDLASLYLEMAHQQLRNRGSASNEMDGRDSCLDLAVKNFEDDDAWERWNFHRIKPKRGKCIGAGSSF